MATTPKTARQLVPLNQINVRSRENAAAVGRDTVPSRRPSKPITFDSAL